MSCSTRHLRVCRVLCLQPANDCASSKRTRQGANASAAAGLATRREGAPGRRGRGRVGAAIRGACAGRVRRRGRSFGSYSAATGDRPQSSCLPPSPSPSTPPRPLLVPLPPHAGRLASTTASQHGGKPSTSQTRAPLKTSQRRQRVRVLVDVPTGTAHPSLQTRS